MKEKKNVSQHVQSSGDDDTLNLDHFSDEQRQWLTRQPKTLFRGVDSHSIKLSDLLRVYQEHFSPESPPEDILSVIRLRLMEKQLVYLSDRRETPTDPYTYYGSGLENNVPVACSMCGSPREDNHARRAIRRAGRDVLRRLRCPTCLVTRRFPARDEDQVSENLDASYLAKPLTYIQRSWWQYLPSTNGAEDLPEQVEVWCHKCGPDTKLTAEGGNTLIDQKSKFIFGIPSKPIIYVEDLSPCWGPNCSGFKSRE